MTVSVSIDEINGEKLLQKSDVVSFSDAIKLNFDQDCADKNQPYYGKMMMLMGIVKDRGISSRAFQQMVKDFIASHKYKSWVIADVLGHYRPAELHNEDWYKKQIATTEFNPEHFEIFLVDEKKWYCFKADADKVKLSNRVQIYRPKLIPRVIEKEQEEAVLSLEEIDYMALHSKIFELEAENERLKNCLTRKEK